LRYFFPEGGREYERGREEMEMNELHVVDDVSELGDEEEEREEEEEEEGEEIPIVDEDVVEDVDIEENPVQDIKETKDEDSLVVVSGPKEELEEIKREEFQKQKKWFSFFSFSKIKKF
jgi:hypothetical protein